MARSYLMLRAKLGYVSALLALLVARSGTGEDVLFEDDFKRGLSDKWQVIGLKETDYRVQNGGFEMRVQSPKDRANPPMLKVILPFTSADSVVVSVKVAALDDFTGEHESAGVYLLDDTSMEFGAKKELIDGKLVYAPGDYRFIGAPGEEGDPSKYDTRYTPVAKNAGPLRIVVDRGDAFFQVGPGENMKYLNFFHSAIRERSKQRGFCLSAVGAPEGRSHWVRFEDFRVVRK
jgi:hypothetical protein